MTATSSHVTGTSGHLTELAETGHVSNIVSGHSGVETSSQVVSGSVHGGLVQTTTPFPTFPMTTTVYDFDNYFSDLPQRSHSGQSYLEVRF